jgi:hypothetical protein
MAGHLDVLDAEEVVCELTELVPLEEPFTVSI